jgi:hypothetical protein
MRALSTVLLGLAVAAPVALAQKAHEYDPAAEVTITGVVLDYHESKKKDDHPGLHFILEIPGAPAEAASESVPTANTADLAPEAAAPEAAASEAAASEAAPEPPSPPAPVETVEVHACPVKLLSQLDFPIEKGDEITVTGSRSGDVVIARVVKKGSAELQLRDEEGVPIWTGLP